MSKVSLILKFIETIIAFIVMLVYRLTFMETKLNCTSDNTIPAADYLFGIDMREFGAFVFYGFFFVSLIQLIGHFNYDNAPTSEFLIALSGFVCYLAVGAKHIQIGIQPSEQEEKQLLPTGCVSLELSFVFLFDSILTVMLSLKE